MKKYLVIVIAATIVFVACRKPKKVETTTTNNVEQQVLTDVANNVVWGGFNLLQSKATVYYNAVNAFNATPNANNLNACKTAWKDMRSTWEQCEGFLYGPVETEQFDPHTDTWPVNYVSLDSLLMSNYPMQTDSIAKLEDALRGYHPMEYLLWGKTSNKTFLQFTTREKQYLLALANDYKNNVDALTVAYNPSSSNSYLNNIFNAGQSGSVYATKKAVYLEMINAMAGICDEVANGKMQEPFAAQDSLLDESPFSGNSLIDFTANIKGAQNVYLGVFVAQGNGISNWVNSKNISLDNSIKAKFNTAIASLQAISGRYEQAIYSQHTQIINAQNAINDLKNALENDLTNLVNQQIKD
ncbi:MAG: hypothetical protein RI955_1436 [Bacteroidota bacterium]|jgi:predicted lipoprotein